MPISKYDDVVKLISKKKYLCILIILLFQDAYVSTEMSQLKVNTYFNIKKKEETILNLSLELSKAADFLKIVFVRNAFALMQWKTQKTRKLFIYK